MACTCATVATSRGWINFTSVSPRKAATTIYLPEGVGAHEKLLARLGEHTTGVACLYLKNLDQVDLDVLERIIDSSYRTVTSGTFGQRARESST